MMKITIPVWRSYEYVEVYLITELRGDRVYKTRSLGYAHRQRPKGEMETYAALPTCLTRGQIEITLELMDPPSKEK